VGEGLSPAHDLLGGSVPIPDVSHDLFFICFYQAEQVARGAGSLIALARRL
jgi:hypothetical protein